MWLHNRLMEEQITLLNETHSRGTGGLLQTEYGDSVTLWVMWIPLRTKYRVKDKGTIVKEMVKFQVSLKELEDNNFTIIEGKTLCQRNGNKFRVESILELPIDDSYLQLIEVTVYKKYKAKEALLS